MKRNIVVLTFTFSGIYIVTGNKGKLIDINLKNNGR